MPPDLRVGRVVELAHQAEAQRGQQDRPGKTSIEHLPRGGDGAANAPYDTEPASRVPAGVPEALLPKGRGVGHSGTA